jgi:hypothetical protein
MGTISKAAITHSNMLKLDRTKNEVHPSLATHPLRFPLLDHLLGIYYCYYYQLIVLWPGRLRSYFAHNSKKMPSEYYYHGVTN